VKQGIGSILWHNRKRKGIINNERRGLRMIIHQTVRSTAFDCSYEADLTRIKETGKTQRS